MNKLLLGLRIAFCSSDRPSVVPVNSLSALSIITVIHPLHITSSTGIFQNHLGSITNLPVTLLTRPASEGVEGAAWEEEEGKVWEEEEEGKVGTEPGTIWSKPSLRDGGPKKINFISSDYMRHTIGRSTCAGWTEGRTDRARTEIGHRYATQI